MMGAEKIENEAAIQLYYYPEENMLYDEGGYPVWNPYQYVTVHEWRRFKDNCTYACVWSTKYKCYVELIYVENQQY